MASARRIDLGPSRPGGLADLVAAGDQFVELIAAVWGCGSGPRLQGLAKPGISGQDDIPSALTFACILGTVPVLVVILHTGYGIHPCQTEVGLDHGAAGDDHCDCGGCGEHQAAGNRIIDGVCSGQDVLEGVNPAIISGGVGHDLAVQDQADIASGNAWLIFILRSIAVDIVVLLPGYGKIPADSEVLAGHIGIYQVHAVGALRREAHLPALLGCLG